MRSFLGVIAGIVMGLVGIIAAQAVMNFIYPFPTGVNIFDKAAMAQVFATMSAAHFASIVATYVVGGLAGAYAARLIAGRNWTLWVPAVFVAVVAALNVFTYPHPLWAQAGALIGPFLGAWIAGLLPAPTLSTARAEERMDDADLSEF